MDDVRADETTSTEAVVSASVPDWSREAKPFWAWQPSRSLLSSLRAYERLAGSRGPWAVLLRKWTVLRHGFWSVVTGADTLCATRGAHWNGLDLADLNGARGSMLSSKPDPPRRLKQPETNLTVPSIGTVRSQMPVPAVSI